MDFTRKGREVSYIHYSKTDCDHFDKSKMYPIRNTENWIKPYGGLWASPINAEWGWKDWCEAENFRDCDERYSFTFKMRDPSKVYFVDSKEAYDNLVKLYGIKNTNSFGYTPQYIDYKRMIEDGWDALELSLTDYWQLYDLFYGWDCDSILIFNAEAVIEEKEDETYGESDLAAVFERETLGDGVFGEWETLISHNQFT